MTVDVVNFGCRLNIAEGEAIRAAAFGRDKLVIINSCAVTEEAERQARQAIRRAARDRPDARIVLTGCAAQIDPGKWESMPEVSAVIGNREKRLAASYEAEATAVGDIFAQSLPVGPVVSGRQHARAFVEIQNGCDHRCTFCIIPFGRGNSASADLHAIVSAIRGVVEGGQKEVILTGVDLTSYAGGLAVLVREILREVPDLPRLRLSSLDPAEVDAALFELLADQPRIMPHVHLSLQSGNDMILKRMKRRHTRAQAVDLVERLKKARPGIAAGADLIAGFPTETDAMAADSLAIVEDCDIAFGHIFPYSPRSGTPAARMPQVPVAIARARAAALREASARRRAILLDKMVGTTQRVLVELNGTSGHAENFVPVTFASETPGTVATICATFTDGRRLFA